MTLTLSAHTETLRQEHSGRLGEKADLLADALLQQALEEAARDYEETCEAIAAGFADVDAGRTVSFEEAWAGREARRAGHQANLSKRTGILWV